jgi:riboflavin kinase/FMN adenylyltransferase
MPPFESDGEIVSSTRIRELLGAGEVRRAGLLLGRPYDIRGTVEAGAGRGTPLGFPTANIRPAMDTTAPADGVYIVEATFDSATRPGVANLGGRPTFGDPDRLVETHLLDFSGDLRGKSMQVAFLERIRGTQPFPSVDALVRQIHHDVETASSWFAQHKDASR